MKQLHDPQQGVRIIGERMEAIARAKEERLARAKAAYEAQVALQPSPPMQASINMTGQRSTSAYVVTGRGRPPGHSG